MDRELPEVVYTPESSLLRPGTLLAAMGRDLLASRDLAWRLFTRNISAQYRQSLLGYAWVFIPPLFSTALWVFLRSQRVIDVGDPGTPYVVFVLTGTVLWQTFVEAVQTPLRIVVESRAMLTKINFPREALLIAGLGQVLFSLLVRAILLVPVLVAYGVAPGAGALWALPGIVALIGLGTTLGVLATPLGILYRDVERALLFGTQILFFLTPIVYPVPQAAWAARLVKLNPVTPLLQATRDWLISGHTHSLTAFLWVSGVTVILLLVGWVLYRISMPHLISRMSA